MRRLLDAVTLHCRKATFLIEKSNDAPLSFLEKVRLNMHLSVCNGCRNYLKQNRFIEHLLIRHAQTTLPSPTDTTDLEKNIISSLKNI